MLNTAGDNDEFTLVQLNVTILQLHHEASLVHEKHFVFIVVMMPDKLAFEFHELQVAVVHFTYDFRTPMFIEQLELFSQVYFFHYRISWFAARCVEKIRSRDSSSQPNRNRS